MVSMSFSNDGLCALLVFGCILLALKIFYIGLGGNGSVIVLTVVNRKVLTEFLRL